MGVPKKNLLGATVMNRRSHERGKIIKIVNRLFRSIRDGYPRYIISFDRLLDQQEGIIYHLINAIDLFPGKEKI